MVPVVFEQEGLLGPPAHGFTLSACVLKPNSRGMVAVTTPDPTAKPFIVHGYYTDPEDVRSGVAGMRMVMDFVRQAPLSRYAETPNVAPASDDDAELERHMRQTCQTIYHPVGTCRMGAEDTAVVDPELRVRGVEALRVVDASVMPSVTRGNTNAPVIAIAERAADLIRGRTALSAEAHAATT
jgi:choline dehydrogenase